MCERRAGLLARGLVLRRRGLVGLSRDHADRAKINRQSRIRLRNCIARRPTLGGTIMGESGSRLSLLLKTRRSRSSTQLGTANSGPRKSWQLRRESSQGRRNRRLSGRVLRGYRWQSRRVCLCRRMLWIGIRRCRGVGTAAALTVGTGMICSMPVELAPIALAARSCSTTALPLLHDLEARPSYIAPRTRLPSPASPTTKHPQAAKPPAPTLQIARGQPPTRMGQLSPLALAAQASVPSPAVHTSPALRPRTSKLRRAKRPGSQACTSLTRVYLRISRCCQPTQNV